MVDLDPMEEGERAAANAPLLVVIVQTKCPWLRTLTISDESTNDPSSVLMNFDIFLILLRFSAL